MADQESYPCIVLTHIASGIYIVRRVIDTDPTIDEMTHKPIGRFPFGTKEAIFADGVWTPADGFSLEYADRTDWQD